MAKPKWTLADFGGNQQLMDESTPIFDAAWDKANPAGTLIGNEVKPELSMFQWKDVGDGAAARQIYDKKVDALLDVPVAERVTQGIADGSLTNKDAYNNFNALSMQALGKAQGMGSFSYDFNSDPIFKALSASYMQQARDAANDASAMAAARTGGYANSYGTAAAGQQYNNALRNLYDQVPALQEAAYNRWQNERSDLYNQAALYNDLAESAYNKDWSEDERAYAREQDAKTWQWNEEGRQHDWTQEEWEKQLTEATTLAQMGEYGKLEELLGVKLDSAKEMDAINKIVAIASAFGTDMMPSVLQSIASGVQNGTGTGSALLDSLLSNVYGSIYGSTDSMYGSRYGQNGQYRPGYANWSVTGYGKPLDTPVSDAGKKEPDIVEETAKAAVEKSSGGGSGSGSGNGYSGSGYSGSGYSGSGSVQVPQAAVPGSGKVTVETITIPDAFANTMLNTLWKS